MRRYRGKKPLSRSHFSDNSLLKLTGKIFSRSGNLLAITGNFKATEAFEKSLQPMSIQCPLWSALPTQVRLQRGLGLLSSLPSRSCFIGRISYLAPTSSRIIGSAAVRRSTSVWSFAEKIDDPTHLWDHLQGRDTRSNPLRPGSEGRAKCSIIERREQTKAVHEWPGKNQVL